MPKKPIPPPPPPPQPQWLLAGSLSQGLLAFLLQKQRLAALRSQPSLSLRPPLPPPSRWLKWVQSLPHRR